MNILAHSRTCIKWQSEGQAGAGTNGQELTEGVHEMQRVAEGEGEDAEGERGRGDGSKVGARRIAGLRGGCRCRR